MGKYERSMSGLKQMPRSPFMVNSVSRTGRKIQAYREKRWLRYRGKVLRAESGFAFGCFDKK